MVHEPLAFVLRSDRDTFNSKFAEARRKYPELDGAVFTEFIQSTLDPIAQACTLPLESLTAVVMAAYEVGLELAGEGLIGNDARGRVMEEAWRKIIPANWPLAASSPSAWLAALSNAVHHLSTNRSCRVKEWIEFMARLSGQCTDLATWLKLGQVLAWRAGMAEFRSGALEVAATLPQPLACAAVGASESANWPALHESLLRDPWCDPRETKETGKGSLRVVAKVGAFRGLGGNFSAPPLVAATHDQLFVLSGDQCWLLIADVFGHSFQRAIPAEFEQARAKPNVSKGIRITAEKITANAHEIANPVPGEPTSFAVLPHTLALTSALTHSVVLLVY